MRIRKEVKNHIRHMIKKYDDSIDHGKLHIASVIGRSFSYGKTFNLSNSQLEIVMVAAAYHDIGLTMGSRDKHELVAEQVVLNDDKLSTLFSNNEIKLIADCCKYHRTSGKEVSDIPIECKIVHDADNSVSINETFLRCISYQFKSFTNYDDFKKGVISHLTNKFSNEGYIKYYLPLPKKYQVKYDNRKDVVNDPIQLNYHVDNLISTFLASRSFTN